MDVEETEEDCSCGGGCFEVDPSRDLSTFIAEKSESWQSKRCLLFPVVCCLMFVSLPFICPAKMAARVANRATFVFLYQRHGSNCRSHVLRILPECKSGFFPCRLII